MLPGSLEGPFKRVLMALHSGYLGYIRGLLGGVGRAYRAYGLELRV